VKACADYPFNDSAWITFTADRFGCRGGHRALLLALAAAPSPDMRRLMRIVLSQKEREPSQTPGARGARFIPASPPPCPPA